MASTAFGSKKRLPGKAYRDGILGDVLDDLYKDVEEGFVAVEAAIAATGGSLYNANTIIKADADNTPVALTVGEATLVGRATGGSIAALTKAQALTLLNVADGAIAAVPAGHVTPAMLAVLGSKVGVPFVIEQDVSANAGSIDIFAANCPFKLRVVDFAAHCAATVGGGTVKLNNGTVATPATDLGPAIAMDTLDNVARASNLVRAQCVINANGSLSAVKAAANNQGWLYITAVRIA